MPTALIIHDISINQVTQEHLYLTVDNKVYKIQWSDCSRRLAEATIEERRLIDIAPSGYGLHWPLINEDLAIDPLLAHAEPLNVFSEPMRSEPVVRLN